MGGSTTSFGAGSFGTATSGVAPLTSFAVCAAAVTANMPRNTAMTVPFAFIQDPPCESLLTRIVSQDHQRGYSTMVSVDTKVAIRSSNRRALRAACLIERVMTQHHATQAP